MTLKLIMHALEAVDQEIHYENISKKKGEIFL